MEHYYIIGGDGVAVNLDCVLAVFLVVGSLQSVGGKFAGLTHGHESGSEFESQNRTADETARLDAYNLRHTLVAVGLREVPSDDVEARGSLNTVVRSLNTTPFWGKSTTSRTFDLMYSISVIVGFIS